MHGRLERRPSSSPSSSSSSSPFKLFLGGSKWTVREVSVGQAWMSSRRGLCPSALMPSKVSESRCEPAALSAGTSSDRRPANCRERQRSCPENLPSPLAKTAACSKLSTLSSTLLWRQSKDRTRSSGQTFLPPLNYPETVLVHPWEMSRFPFHYKLYFYILFFTTVSWSPCPFIYISTITSICLTVL